MVKTKKKSKFAWLAKSPKKTITTGDDLKMAILLVSVTINVAIFITWLAIKLSNKYDDQVAQFLFG